jgi:hypothetical protein
VNAMILGIQLPEGATFKQVEDGKLMIIFDESISKQYLYQARLHTWLTNGSIVEDFYTSKTLDYKNIEISHRNKLSLHGSMR